MYLRLLMLPSRGQIFLRRNGMLANTRGSLGWDRIPSLGCVGVFLSFKIPFLHPPHFILSVRVAKRAIVAINERTLT